jgi:dolichol-phosphate mannosyltransferase
MDRISIIIPTLNEEDNVQELLERVFKALNNKSAGHDFEVIVVDDDSTDGTRQQVRKWMADKRVRLICRNKEKKGLSSAVINGAKAASGEVIVVMDADLSHPPEAIPDLIRPIMNGEKDMVVGSRYVLGGSTPGWSIKRILASKAAALPARMLTDLRDPLSGFFAIKKNILLSLGRDVPGFKIGLAVLVRGVSLRTDEVPIRFTDRKNGTSKANLRVGFCYFKQILELAGGNISRRTGFRFALVGLLGILVDFSLFQALFAAGAGIGLANSISFTVAVLVNYCLNKSWAFPDPKGGWAKSVQKGLLFTVIALLALFLRGGVLALLANSWHWPVSLALMAAIATAAFVNYLGSAFVVFPSDAHAFNPEMRWRVLAVLITGYTVALRLVFIGLPELMMEEAYYWNYGQHLALGYLDHPPLLAWLIRASNEIFGTTEWSVRLVAFLSWLVTAFFCFRITRALYDRSVAFRALILVSILPAFFCTGFLSTPDAPLIACWAAALYFLYTALIREQASAWYEVGIALGLGMLSKYTIALLVPCIFVFLLIHKDARKWLVKPQPYLGAALAFLLFSPVVIWNVEHHWASFIFQGPRRFTGSFNFSLAELLGAILLLLTPTGLLVVAAFIKGGASALKSHCFAKVRNPKFLFSLVFTLIPFAVFLFFSLFRQVKLNWTAPVWLAVLPFMAYTMIATSRRRPNRILSAVHRSWPGTILCTLLILGAFLYHSVLGFPGLPYPGDQPFLLGWQNLALYIEDFENRIESKHSSPIVVGLDKYRIASGLAFYRTKILEKDSRPSFGEGTRETAGRHFLGQNSLMYAFWFPEEKYAGRDMILVSDAREDLGRKNVTGSFRKMGDIREVALVKNRKPVRSYYYRLGESYLPLERDYAQNLGGEKTISGLFKKFFEKG